MTQNSHPLEKVFDLEPSTWEAPLIPRSSEREKNLLDPTTGEFIPRVVEADPASLEKEERLEDLHIDGQLETIHTAAMDAYEKQVRMSEEVDPRFAARNAEVAAQYLTIALNATNSRVDAKFKRQKVRLQKTAVAVAQGSTTVTNSNVIIADRNAVLKALLEKGKSALGDDNDTVDA